jgi:hypothetical protein
MNENKTISPTAFMVKRLTEYYNSHRCVTINELRIGTGYNGLNKRRIDFLAISAEKGNIVVGAEIKASRADYLKDIKDAQKQKALRCFSNYFYYVTPKGLIEPNDLPPWAGLIEIRTDATDKQILIRGGAEYFRENNDEWLLTPFVQIRINAPYLENFSPTWGLVAEVIRKKEAR